MSYEVAPILFQVHANYWTWSIDFANILLETSSNLYLSRILCDEDGFALKLNDDPPFPHYLHAMPLENITELEVKGSLQLRCSTYM